jgi:hypothetical protein
MERGKSKAETGREHLERNDFILAKQQQKLIETKAEQAQIEADTAAKQEQCVSLDRAIADKEELLKSERKCYLDSILSGAANALGMGKYAKIDAENKRMGEDIASYKQKLSENAKRTIRAEVERQTTSLNDMLAKSQSEYLDMRTKYNNEVAAHNELKHSVSYINNVIVYRNRLLRIIAELLFESKDLLKRVIRHIINFATEKYRNRFDSDEVTDIKQLIDEYTDNIEGKKAIGSVLVILAAEEGHLSEIETHKADHELADVAEGYYDRLLNQRSGYIR